MRFTTDICNTFAIIKIKGASLSLDHPMQINIFIDNENRPTGKSYLHTEQFCEINEPNHNCIIKNKTTELIETASFTSRNQQNRNNNTDGEKAT
jgi:hypothetical protein